MSTPTLDHPHVTNGRLASPPFDPPVRQPPVRRRNPLTSGFALVALLAALGGAGAVTALLFATGAVGGSTKVTSVVETGVVAARGSNASLDARAIYASAAAGAVDITAQGTNSSQAGPLAPQSQSAAGSGSIIDGQGHILTAAHVVDGASSVTVTFQGGQTRAANVLGVDDSTDVAVLQVNPSGLTLHSLPVGQSRSLVVGDALAIIGDPYQYDRSLSTGVVSAVDRTIQAPNGFTVAHAIQTDAALNPGNSGGPVLDAHGRLVGIADQIAGSSSGSVSSTGVGFAVPIDVAAAELSALEHGGQVNHAYIGVGTAQATNQNGALVESVEAGSPAAAAGIRTGDVVTAIDGAALKGSNDMVAAIASHRPGDRLTVDLQRGSTRLTVTVTLVAQPSQAPAG